MAWTPTELISADDLWWYWAVVAATKGEPKGTTAALLEDDHVLTLDQGNSWVRMQRLRGGRALLWGRITLPPVADHVDVLFDAAGLGLLQRRLPRPHQQDPEFLAWYAHGEWDSNTPRPVRGLPTSLRGAPHPRPRPGPCGTRRARPSTRCCRRPAGRPT